MVRFFLFEKTRLAKSQSYLELLVRDGDIIVGAKLLTPSNELFLHSDGI